jgi:hypothetical protein
MGAAVVFKLCQHPKSYQVSFRIKNLIDIYGKKEFESCLHSPIYEKENLLELHVENLVNTFGFVFVCKVYTEFFLNADSKHG